MIEDGQVTEHAKQIWWAGVNAARADRLIESHVRTAGNLLHIGTQTLPGDSISRLALVGVGKAAEAMAYGFFSPPSFNRSGRGPCDPSDPGLYPDNEVGREQIGWNLGLH